MDFKKYLTATKNPDFNSLIEVITGKSESERVHIVELPIDPEVLRHISEKYLEKKWYPPVDEYKERYFQNIVDLYLNLGYDGFLVGAWHHKEWLNHPTIGIPTAEDTSDQFSRKSRQWALEGKGMIRTWQDFDTFPWDEITVDYGAYEILERLLKPGMKIFISSCLFEHILEYLLGYEGLFFNIQDEPDLVEAVFQKWGEKVDEYYRNVIDLQIVGGIWHADDLGFKTGTMLSPADLDKLLFPWIKKYAQLAHDHDKVCLLHACGNYYENGIIETFIDDLKLDAIHSHQDSIWPIAKCLKNFGDRIGFLGGVDLDKLCRLDESNLRKYVREILNACLPGRFAIGSGNSIANYIPIENYFVMLDEAFRWNLQ